MKRTKPPDIDFVPYEGWAKPVKPKSKRKKTPISKKTTVPKAKPTRKVSGKVPAVPAEADIATASTGANTFTFTDPYIYPDVVPPKSNIWQHTKDFFSRLFLR